MRNLLTNPFPPCFDFEKATFRKQSYNSLALPKVLPSTKYVHTTTGQSLAGLVRVQPVKFFSDWPKFEGFKSLTPLRESEKKPFCGGSSDFQKITSSREYGRNVY